MWVRDVTGWKEDTRRRLCSILEHMRHFLSLLAGVRSLLYCHVNLQRPRDQFPSHPKQVGHGVSPGLLFSTFAVD